MWKEGWAGEQTFGRWWLRLRHTEDNRRHEGPSLTAEISTGFSFGIPHGIEGFNGKCSCLPLSEKSLENITSSVRKQLARLTKDSKPPKLHKIHLVLRLVLSIEEGKDRTRSCLLISRAGSCACVCTLGPRAIPWFYQFLAAFLSTRSACCFISYPANTAWCRICKSKDRPKAQRQPILSIKPYLINNCS